MTAAVCPGSGTGLPSPALPAAGGARWPWLAYEWCSRDTRPRRGQRTSRHGAAAVGSLGRAGRGPTPPAATSAPSHTPPRRCLRGVQATQRARTNRRIGMPVYAAVDGPVRAAADTPSPLDCPRARLGCQAAFLPPVGSARRSNRCGALPHRAAPQMPPRARACGLPPSLPRPALAP
jgi:hypothetical protein